MLMDVIGPSFNPNVTEDIPNLATQELYEMLKASEQEVWPGNPYGHSKLSAVARLLNLKAKHHFSEGVLMTFSSSYLNCYQRIMS